MSFFPHRHVQNTVIISLQIDRNVYNIQHLTRPNIIVNVHNNTIFSIEMICIRTIHGCASPNRNLFQQVFHHLHDIRHAYLNIDFTHFTKHIISAIFHMRHFFLVCSMTLKNENKALLCSTYLYFNIISSLI